MSNKNRNKRPDRPPPAVSPPGRVQRGGHGLLRPVGALSGAGRLRKKLGLSNEVPIERVCEEAAGTIEALEAQASKR